ncbi:MAG: hypothetical protein HY287_05390 [Planctomycetes bacterium]|nr:hypothetical protein [Planctomycetota bacterium]MBI3833744.1 hypothetical protein [Planctomycetota bacterium]
MASNETAQFENRLKVLLGGIIVAALVVGARLAQLQIADAAYYRQQAEQSVILKPTPLPFVRGSIRDREGEILVTEQPCWELAVDFGVIAADLDTRTETALREAKRRRREGRYAEAHSDAELLDAFRADISVTWSDLTDFAAEFAPVREHYLRDQFHDVYDRVMRMRQAVAERRGFDAPVADESRPQPILRGLSMDAQITAREAFAGYPWIHIRPSAERRFSDNIESFAHILGRVGAVDADDVRNDPNQDDPFAEYQPGDRRGVSGVESAAESILRGRRGQITVARDGSVVEEIPAENGRDAELTILGTLQRRLYALLGDAVQESTESNGGVIVVLDVASREVLALVSYPSYDPNRFDELYPQLRDDTERMPLRFRAVASQYPPGSTIKPLIGITGLMSGRLTIDHTEDCTGYLFPDRHDVWRCWEVHGTGVRRAHGSINLTQALTGSCNVFMYHLGERLGIDRLCGAFDMVGLGRGSGIGLPEDAAGINPTPQWLMRHKHQPVTPGNARLYAIGQGEVSASPVQVANLMATYACGRYRPVTLLRSSNPTPEWTLPATPDQWHAVREGIYGVVNHPEGTAYKFAHFENDHWALCGKTGSATAKPWPTAWRVQYTSENGEQQEVEIPEGSKANAIRRFEADYPRATFDAENVTVACRWPKGTPPEGENFSHAWFGGFLQARDSSGRPDWSVEPTVAFAALVEYGGSGGQTSGPLAKRIASELLEILGPNLNAHRRPRGVNGT